MFHTETDAEEFFAHYGVKGMRWGGPKEGRLVGNHDFEKAA